jgi:signal peptidase II
MGSRFRPYLTFWGVAVAALVADVWTKALVARHLPFNTYFPDADGTGPWQLLPRLWIVHVGNKGAAWGLGSEHDVRPFLVLLALAVLGFVWHWRQPLLRELRGGQLAFGLFVGGTLGNVRDRVFGDHVVDFIDVHLPYYRFPAFNVADACICVGVGLYLWLSYRHDAARRAALASHAGEDAPPPP